MAKKVPFWGKLPKTLQYNIIT